jgi:hypothetical protein
MDLQRWIAAAALAACSLGAQAADVSISVGGEIAPGVYGRIDIGDRPPPPVVYSAPVMIVRPAPNVVVGPPIYLNVPPGHAKDWGKHCRKYNACGQRVYFVKTAEYEPGYRGPGKGGKGGGDDHGKGPGKGHGNGKGKD